jgi:D-beta-D-heptose 7-phosphate kinase/D-beta-D-heptose 1-phosphate adenosyltransferase
LSGSERARLEAVIERMEGLRVLVVGDLMLDEYRVGDVARISPEAPVPIVRVHEERYELGGAGNVARNLVSLGASASLVGILGPDREGSILRERVLASGIPVEGLIESRDRRTTHKLRVVARAQQMLRLDREDESPLTPGERARVEQAIFERLEACDAVILADYDKGVFAEGVFSHGLGRTLIAAAGARGIPVSADPKRELQRFRGATLVKPNLAEACAAVGGRGDDFESRSRLLEKLRAELAGAEVVVTRGGEGISALGADGRPFDVPARRLAVYDVQGAGDTSMATLVLCRTAGASLREACVVANAAAAVAVSKVGTAAVTRAELRARLAEGPDLKLLTLLT